MLAIKISLNFTQCKYGECLMWGMFPDILGFVGNP